MSDSAHRDFAEQRREYFKIFKFLIALTILEVIFVMLPLPRLLITLLVVTASCSKAGLVGYYYMHLSHETKWLKIVACLPLLLFGYLAVLGPDSLHRPFSVYANERPRIFPPHHGEMGEDVAADEAAKEAQKELKENTERRLEAEKSGAVTSPAPVAAPAAGAPSSGSGASSGGAGADDFR